MIGFKRAPRQLIWPDHPYLQRGLNRVFMLCRVRRVVARSRLLTEASGWIVDKDARTGRIDGQQADLSGTGH